MPSYRKRTSVKRKRSTRRKVGAPYKRRRTMYKRRSYGKNKTKSYRPNWGNAKRIQWQPRWRPTWSKHAKYIGRIAKKVMDMNTVQSFRDIFSAQVESGVNEHAYFEVPFLDRTSITDALKNNRMGIQGMLSNPVDLTTGEASLTENTAVASTRQRSIQWRIINSTMLVKYRNNSNTPCEAVFYKLKCRRRQSTNDSPISQITKGLEDSGIGATAINDLRFSPKDSPLFLDYYSILSQTRKTLQPGDEHVVSFKRMRPFTYPGYEAFHHPTSFQDPRWSQYMLVKVKGTVCHSGTTTTTVGRCPSTLDIEISRSVKFVSTAEQKRRELSHADAYLPALPEQPVVGQKPSASVLVTDPRGTTDPFNFNMPVPTETTPVTTAAIADLVTEEKEQTDLLESIDAKL